MRKHNEILETRADEKVLKALGKDVAEELDTLSEAELKSAIVASLESMSEASEKLAANPKYQDLKRTLDDVTAGKKDVDKYQGAKIKYCRKRLREMGKLAAPDRQELSHALVIARREMTQRRFDVALKAKEPKKPRCGECGQEEREIAYKDGTPSTYECYRCVTLPAFHAGQSKAS